MTLLEDHSQLAKLYYRYKNRSDGEIAEYLKKIKIIIEKEWEDGPFHGFGKTRYMELSQSAIDRISFKPRNHSLSFDMLGEFDQIVKANLKEYKTILYLVKSSSRFFLKPDIGEIIDQIDMMDLHYKIKAICFNPDEYQLLDGTDGEHFIMRAKLMV